MRYLIKFTKESDIKFISHLDLMRTIQRVIRRAGLPIEYSKGFNPHMNLSIANPLSVGFYSEGDYLDIGLSEELSEDEIRERLNSNSAQGIRFLEVSKVINKENEKKVPQAMALIDAARYIIKIKYSDTTLTLAEIESLMQEAEWVTLKKSKNGEKMADIKPMVKELKYWINEDRLILNALISCGSREHLSPELLATYIRSKTTNYEEEAFIDIKREELYAYKAEALVPLYKYI
ncbi:TIGR03936 family radical SAM-associated protein [Clostridium manihotivorum]|uniref:Radical SAM protein n=1 Tax=Clostridium manihotivorum TaxID=2320868 RepID=A0A410DQZ0_9CLOT|nr:TIGR03936 family radical SAM-associated protein [Clostridium manihotivorum]QAA31514.1 radical SAM protein [Clostridium manihotivorum]